MTDVSRPRLAFIGTGGTISNAGTGSLDYLSYLDRGKVLETSEVLAMHPEVSEMANIEPIAFGRFRSKAVGSLEWIRLLKVLTKTLEDPDFDGAVVAHGTGSMEETAYFIHLTLNSSKPVVFVGAQRPPSTLSSDAALNMVDAVRVATSPLSTGMGVLVVMDQTIHCARDITKASNHALGTMESPMGGPLGEIKVDGSVDFYRKPIRRHTTESKFLHTNWGLGPLPRVDIAYVYAEADGSAVEAFLRQGAKGLVVAGFAPGVNTPALESAVQTAIESETPVVQASRAYRDAAVLNREALEGTGILVNNTLSLQHARVLLQLSIADGLTHPQIQTVFTDH